MASGTFYPAASADDGYGGTWDNSSNSLRIGYSAFSFSAAIRFVNVTIPQGSTIDSAFVRLFAYSYQLNIGAGNPVYVRIHFEDADDAAQVSDKADCDDKDRTTAYADWDIGDDGWGTDWSQQDTPSLVSPLQELVNRGAFASGNAAQLLIDHRAGEGGKDRYATAVDYDSGSYKAELHVEWTPPAAPSGWSETFNGVASPASVNGVAATDIASVNGVS